MGELIPRLSPQTRNREEAERAGLHVPIALLCLDVNSRIIILIRLKNY